MKKLVRKTASSFQSRLIYICLLLFFTIENSSAKAQCPPNIDFENGDFAGWRCWIGSVASVNGKNLITWAPAGPVAPVFLRHTMLNSFPGDGLDPYGFFPRNCPNGSGHSVQLGNEGTQSQAEGLSYTFTIPPGADEYNLIYHYAVVLQDPSHTPDEQPRMMISVRNLTDGGIELPCPLNPFVPSGGLPGFDTSKILPASGIVLFKNWAAASIELNGLAGKTIEIFFTTADCTRTGHFGYAYIDVNSECSSSFTGAVFCADDAFINVTAPHGYKEYKWWNAADPTTILGVTQTINFTPPPPPGTVLKVLVTPYAGYGCSDTLTAVLLDTLTINAQAGPDEVSCNGAQVQIGNNPKPGYVYSWSPTTGLSDPNIANPIALPTINTEYILTVSNAGGGCPSEDTVNVVVDNIDNSIQLIGPPTFCSDGVTTAILEVLSADSIQWYRNGVAILGANQTQYNVPQSGLYYATLFKNTGCILSTVIRAINIFDSPVAGFTTNSLDQCFNNNQVAFTNSSTVATGTLQYSWDFGDGFTSTARDVSHNYGTPGIYQVKLVVTTNNGCRDSSSTTVNIFESPTAGFTANTASQCFSNNQFSFTNTSSISAGSLQYTWDFGDGSFATATDVTHNYTAPGVYTVRLIALSDKNCSNEITTVITVHPNPEADFNLNSAAAQCFKNNSFNFKNTTTITGGNLHYTWDMGNGDTFASSDVTYSYPLPGTYTVKLMATSGNSCVDSSEFNVTVFPVPVAGFTVSNATQCLNINQFTFNNISTVYSGGLQYKWSLGDGNTATTANANHSYTQPGSYTVKLLSTATNGGCTDSSSFTVRVLENPVADFTINSICIEIPVEINNKTINAAAVPLDYLWDFGNGHTATGVNPVYSYPAPGNYTVKLTVNISQCPSIIFTKEMPVIITAPLPGITYPPFEAKFYFPEQLQARPIGNTVLWTPATALNNPASYSPIFKGINTQLYEIRLTTDLGCVTVDTLLVKTVKRIEVHVPTAFTPNNDGKNDRLRPLLFGIEKVNYFRIYNRWGNMVFQMQSDQPGWDGKINGILQGTQVFVWMIEVVDIDGQIHREKGTTTLLR